MQHTRVEPGAGELLALAERRLDQLEAVDVGQRIVDGRVRVDGGGLDSEQRQSAAVSCKGLPSRAKGIAIGGNWRGGTNRGLGVGGLAVGAVRHGNIVGPAHGCGFGEDAVVRRGSCRRWEGLQCKMCVGDGETEAVRFFFPLGRDTYLWRE